MGVGWVLRQIRLHLFAMATYLGISVHGLDDKARLIIPKRLLDEVAPTDRDFTLTAGFDGCLMLLDQPAWQKVAAMVGQDLLGSRQQRNMRRVFLAHAEPVRPDRSNRIVIAAALRSYAGIDESSEVVMVGTGQAVELWSKQRWQAALQSAKDNNEFSDNNLVGSTAVSQS